jgi:hypothetical protein
MTGVGPDRLGPRTTGPPLRKGQHRDLGYIAAGGKAILKLMRNLRKRNGRTAPAYGRIDFMSIQQAPHLRIADMQS